SPEKYQKLIPQAVLYPKTRARRLMQKVPAALTLFFAQTAKTPIPFGVFCQDLVQILFAEIWPEDLREEPFTISGLPGQKVAGAFLARGADNDFRVWRSGSEHCLTHNLNI